MTDPAEQARAISRVMIGGLIAASGLVLRFATPSAASGGRQ